MGLHYNGEIGILYNKETEEPVSKVEYQLIETEPTKYTKKRWRGEISSIKKIDKAGVYRIELEDGRNGDCIVWNNSNSDTGQKKFSHYN